MSLTLGQGSCRCKGIISPTASPALKAESQLHEADTELELNSENDTIRQLDRAEFPARFQDIFIVHLFTTPFIQMRERELQMQTQKDLYSKLSHIIPQEKVVRSCSVSHTCITVQLHSKFPKYFIIWYVLWF